MCINKVVSRNTTAPTKLAALYRAVSLMYTAGKKARLSAGQRREGEAK